MADPPPQRQQLFRQQRQADIVGALGFDQARLEVVGRVSFRRTTPAAGPSSAQRVANRRGRWRATTGARTRA